MTDTYEVQESEHYLHRPYLRKSTRENIERVTDKRQFEFKQNKANYSKKYDGKVRNGPLRDANTGEIIRGKPDIGHKSGYEERTMRECAERMHMTQKEYNDMMNDPKLYHFEDKSNNRQHGFEETDHKTQVSRAMRTINRYYDEKGKDVDKMHQDRMSDREIAVRNESHGEKDTGNAGHLSDTGAGKTGHGFSGGHTSTGSSSGSTGGHGFSGGHTSTGASSGSAGGHGFSGGHASTGASGGSTGSGGHGGSSGGASGGGGHGGSSGGASGGGGHGGSSGGASGGGGHGGSSGGASGGASGGGGHGGQ